jgi:arylsulfatase A-like enzyme
MLQGMRCLPRQHATGRLVVAVALLIALASGASGAEPAPRPNVVVIVADDMGFSDLGSYGGEIETPHLDALAQNGLRFTQFYTTGRCWPTRAALLTGYYAQQVRRDFLTHPLAGEMTRPPWAMLLPAMLRTAGYRSYHSGKWHIDGMPLQNGFDRSYLLEDQGRFFSPLAHYEDDQPLPPVPPGSGYYATTAIADRAIAHLADHQRAHAGTPFFQLVAFTAPHYPLHALPEDVARYRDRYLGGWDDVRNDRWSRMQDLGLVRGPLSAVEYEVGPPYDFPWDIFGPGEINRPKPWPLLTDGQREFQAMKMSLHAAMVDRMDREVGRLLHQLRAMDVLDDTLVFFLADNGASSEIMVRDDGHDPAARPGSAPTHYCLGPGWSTVGNTPFRRHKTWVHEGGIATSLVAHWPRGIAARGALRETPGHVIDLVPTVLELAGVQSSPAPQGPRRPGRSLVPALVGSGGSVSRDLLWWLHEENRAIRVGDWKLVSARSDGGAWELYDLARDRAESDDLARDMPWKVRELSRLWLHKARQFARDAESLN